MFEILVDFIMQIKEIVVPFTTNVMSFLSYHPLGFDYTVFELLFGIGVTAYLVFAVAKYLVS